MVDHEKAGRSHKFFYEKYGSQNDADMIGWLQFYCKILFNEIEEITIFCMCGVTYFFLKYLSSLMGHKMFDYPIGESQGTFWICKKPVGRAST